MEGGRAVVLIVEQDPEMRDRIGSWLESDGHQVLACPGPTHPDYTCVAARGTPCALANAADVVVLDLWLASDRLLMGTSSTRLLGHYLAGGQPVVAISSRPDNTRLAKLFLEEALIVVEWPPERRELCETVRAVLREEASDTNSKPKGE